MVTKGKGSRRREQKSLPTPRRNRPSTVMMTALVTAIVMVTISAVIFFQIVNSPKDKAPSPGIVDCTGRRASTSDNVLSSVTITVRNNGSGSMDLAHVSLSWQGPVAQKTLYLDKTSWSKPSKESFAVGGTGTKDDGWDPAAGKFTVESPTVAFITLNLTAQGGINDPLGPGQSFRVVLTIEGGGPGSGNSETAAFKVPSSLGQGLNVVLTLVK